MQRRPASLPPARRLAAALLAASLAFLPSARAQTPHYATMAGQPDPLSFVKRAETHLTLQDDPLRFGGINIRWLGQRQDAGQPARRPTLFEVQDALATAQALGAAVIRVPGLASSSGCALCLESTPGTINPDAMAQLDLVLATARDMGLKVILPLADAATPDGFFTDPQLQAAFLARLQTVLGHVNSRTSVAYGDDPTILAWENCDGCGAHADAHTVSAWVETVGQAIKSADKRHLYENGAFAGSLGLDSPHPMAAALFATPSVDIVGDRLALHGDSEAARRQLGDAVANAARAGRAYVLDDFGWAPSLFPSQENLEAWLGNITRARDLTGALTGNLESHADRGGYLPPGAPTSPGESALYFPGRQTAEMDLPTMQERGRALRRFNYAMAGLVHAPTYLLPPQPEILSAAHGKLVWRGAAGAANYTIERSPDPSSPFTWTTVCDACVTDDPGTWQDPHPEGPQWYRLMPNNINGHHAVPSAPVSAGQ